MHDHIPVELVFLQTNGWNFCHIQLPISHAGDYDKKQDLGDVAEVTICTYFQSIYNSDPGSS